MLVIAPGKPFLYFPIFLDDEPFNSSMLSMKIIDLMLKLEYSFFIFRLTVSSISVTFRCSSFGLC